MRGKTCILFMTLMTVFMSCDVSDSGGSGSGSWTISGTVSVISNVLVGRFSSDYWFVEDFGGEEDVVYEEWNSSSTNGEFSPLHTVSPEADGSFSIALPENVEDMGDLIAWVDSDGDGMFNLGTESGYFPWKEIEGTDYVVSFGYAISGSYSTYTINYYDGINQIVDIEIIGSSGFFFTLD